MIQVLPSHIANLIAAGEVVQRPSSVVKELMENSVDSDATAVTLILADFGKTSIQVVDNGCGMTPDEAQLCFQRHATSKISSAQDLYSIHTYGFRGEALPSIAACSQVVLKTRKEGTETGTEVTIEANEIKSVTQTTTPVGTNIQVKNIFYNIPARRKFLKSDTWEYKQIIQEFTRVALTRIDIEFKLIHNSKEIFLLSPVQNLKQRIIQICGKDLNKELVDIHTDTTIIKISGYIGRPQSAKKSQQNQYLFVNNRFFKSPVLHRAIMKAYDNLLPNDYLPSYFIFLETEPGSVDVNIHPSKTEIKFEDENVIFNILTASVKEAIGENAFAPAIDFDMEGAHEMPAAKADYYVPSPPKISYDPLFNPFVEEGKMKPSQWNSRKEWDSKTSSDAEKEFSTPSYNNENNGTGLTYNSALFNDSIINERPSITIKNKYLITTVKTGLLVVDIFRAKERILYEQFRETINETQANVQELLYPQEMQLDYETYVSVLPYLPELKKLGFDVRDNGNNNVIMYGTPASLKGENVSLEEVINDLLITLSDPAQTDFDTQFKDRLAMQLVKNLSGNTKEINNTEAGIIIDSLFACSDPYTSPTGKRCMTIISLGEIEGKLD